MKKFLKKHYQKFICALTIISILCMISITSFAYFPDDGISFTESNAVTVYKANNYFYRSIIQKYNWNRIPQDGDTFNTNFGYAWLPFGVEYNSQFLSSDIFNVLVQLGQSLGYTDFNNIAATVVSYEIFIYYDILTSSTRICFIPTKTNNPGYYIDNVKFVTYSGNGVYDYSVQEYRKFYSLNAAGTGIANASVVPRSYTFIISNDGRTFTYNTYDLNGTSILFANQNILYYSSNQAGEQSLFRILESNVSSVREFVNLYTYNNFNKAALVYFDNPVRYFEENGSGNNIQIYESMIASSVSVFNSPQYSLDFTIYSYGAINFDFNLFFMNMNFIRNMYGNGFNLGGYFELTFAPNSYSLISTAFIRSLEGIELYVYKVRFIFTASTNDSAIISASSKNTFDIVYFESLNWATSLKDNVVLFSTTSSLSNVGAEIESLWENMQDTFEFVVYLQSRLMSILPTQIYGFIVLSLAVVIALSTLRLVI